LCPRPAVGGGHPFLKKTKENQAMTTVTNGQTRQTLASQLDRLDGILDGLSAALEGSVSEAVSKVIESTIRVTVAQAVEEAVRAVLIEVTTNPDLQQQLRQAAALPPPAPDDHADNTRGPLGRAWDATTAWVKQAIRSALAAGVVIGGAAAGAFFVARSWFCRAAEAVWSWGTGLVWGVASALGSLLPVAWCT
jgi:hypothetical protein